MKFTLQLSCLLLASAGLLAADVPSKPLPSRYRALWTDSLFTVKKVEIAGPVYNSLMDYVLLGVSPIKEGYIVTLMDRKKPNDAPVMIESERTNPQDIQIKKVLRKAGDPLGTRVEIARGGSTAIVGFEDKFLTLKPPTPQVNQAKVPRQTPPGVNPQNPATGSGATRAPRPRIIPPTPPTPNNLQNQPATQGGGGSSSQSGSSGGTSGFQNRFRR